MRIVQCSLYAPSFPLISVLLNIHDMLQDGDVEHGSALLPGLVLIEAPPLSMDDMVARCCEELETVLRRSIDTSTGTGEERD